MTTFIKLGDQYESQLIEYSNFKIGKTGKLLEDKYKEEYADMYKYYEEIGNSDKEETIDNFEKYLIERFKNHANCDNEQIGSGEMKLSNNYIVYIVYNK